MFSETATIESCSSTLLALLKAISNKRRFAIICRLVDGEKNVTTLQNDTGLEQSALSQHLAKLRNAGLVKTRREARTIYYSVADEKIIDLIRYMCQMYKC